MGNTLTGFVRAGDLPGVRYCLEKGSDVNERRGSNYTPLITAAYVNNCEMIELLLDRGAHIEAVDNSGLSALRTAIYYDKKEAAIALVKRGANVSTKGYQQRTALHAAVQKGQLDVVEALLLAGADPTIVSGSNKETITYISGGRSGGQLWRLLTTFSSLATAIEARNIEAVSIMLNKTLTIQDSTDKPLQADIPAENPTDKALQAYKTTRYAVTIADGEWQMALSRTLEQFEINWLNHALHLGSTELVDVINKNVDKQAWISTAQLDPDGRRALHVAASLKDVNTVCHLLTHHGGDPIAVDHKGKKAIDLVSADDKSESVHWVLMKHEKKTKFMELTFELLLRDEVTTAELHGLVGYMTSIYDLRVVFCLAFRAVTADEMTRLLETAFTKAVQSKLMFENEAAVFFKAVLRACRRQNFISRNEMDRWVIEAGHVNGENANWVRDIQNSLMQLECRVTITEKNISSLYTNYSFLRKALEDKERHDTERSRRERLIGLVSCALFACAGPFMREVFNSVFDVWESAEMLAELTGSSSDTLENSLGNAANKLVCKHGVEPAKFSNLLHETIALERGEARAKNNNVRGVGQPCEGKEDNADFLRAKPNLRFRDAVLLVKNRLDEERNQNMTRNIPASELSDVEDSSSSMKMLVDHSHLTNEDFMTYPYHYVVFYSHGDLDKFIKLVGHVTEEDGDASATMKIWVPVSVGGIIQQSTPVAWQTVQASPVTYASYLGYTDIVEWLLDNGYAGENDKGFAVIARSLSVSKSLVEIATAA